ncbi:uncharacterized protein LOC111001609 [Pieris rapae]|uniref:uncharacterized protein LOC111001609 n=1 Tax=Pieris rapae TaxID=64459 RepID=UPI000B92A859|nr:uncharacterized protein LOC111001609 [Pieris rapae]
MQYLASVLILNIFGVLSYEYEGYGRNNMAVGRRDVIPMNEVRRRNVIMDRNYRRTKDIRTDIYDRRFEEAQWREARGADDRDRLDRLHRELRWLTINSNELGIGY